MCVSNKETIQISSEDEDYLTTQTDFACGLVVHKALRLKWIENEHNLAIITEIIYSFMFCTSSVLLLQQKHIFFGWFSFCQTNHCILCTIY